MKTLLFLCFTTLCLSPIFAKQSIDESPTADRHSTIYTAKLVAIVNALNVGSFNTETAYQRQLSTACQRNQCSSLEKQTIKSIGQQIVHCKLKHLKSHKIVNSDANVICGSEQAMLGCDSLATPLLRKMCYTGNRYSLKALKLKERNMKKRLPASTK